MSKIPSVDLKKFLSEDEKIKREFVQNIGDAFSNIGFVSLSGHFLDDELVDELYTEVKKFFSLNDEIKNKYIIEGIGGQRGYTSFGKETAKGFKAGDLKEFWHFGQYDYPINVETKEYPENIEVTELPNFNKVGKKAYKQLEKTAKFVLRALALYLKLEENYFDKYIEHGNSILRPIHYPPIEGDPKDAVRAAPHGDINLITLLMGAHGKGLQVQDHKGNWVDAIAQKDQLMINVGDMLSRLSNNRLKSTIHQVVNPPSELMKTSRYSIPFFMHPISSMKLNCLEECIDDQNPKLFDDCTAGEYLQERLVELGLIKE
jgi:isopenicillin N synthase-like dioxygenase